MHMYVQGLRRYLREAGQGKLASKLALGPALRVSQGHQSKLHKQALRILHEVEEHWICFYGGWCDRWEAGPEKGVALAPQWILGCLGAGQAWELGTPLYTLQPACRAGWCLAMGSAMGLSGV